jgi:hypothetical protein
MLECIMCGTRSTFSSQTALVVGANPGMTGNALSRYGGKKKPSDLEFLKEMVQH